MDFAASVTGNDEGDRAAGKVYLIFGRSCNWNIQTSLSDANASFIGE